MAITNFQIDGSPMSSKQVSLRSFRCGDTREVEVVTSYGSGASQGDPRPMDAYSFLVYDSTAPVEGTATATGTTTTLISTALTQADNYWAGVPLIVTVAGVSYLTEVTASDQSSTNLTFYAIPVAVAAGATYTLLGTPLAARTRTVLETEGETPVPAPSASVTFTLDDTALGRPGTKVLVFRPEFSDGESEELVAQVVVYAGTFIPTIG